MVHLTLYGWNLELEAFTSELIVPMSGQTSHETIVGKMRIYLGHLDRSTGAALEFVHPVGVN